MKGYTGLFLVSAALSMLAIACLVVLSDGTMAGTTIVEGPWNITEPTTIDNGTWIVKNGSIDISSTFNIHNATLVLEGYGITLHQTGELIISGSNISGGMMDFRIYSQGIILANHTVFSMGPESYISQMSGIMTFEGCSFKGGRDLFLTYSDLHLHNSSFEGFNRRCIYSRIYDWSPYSYCVTIEDCSFTGFGEDEDVVYITEGYDSGRRPVFYIRRNLFEGSGKAIWIEAALWRAYGIYIEDNHGKGCGVEITSGGSKVSLLSNVWEDPRETGIRIYHSIPHIEEEYIRGGTNGLVISGTRSLHNRTLEGLLVEDSINGVVCDYGLVNLVNSTIRAVEHDFVVTDGDEWSWSKLRVYDCVHRGRAKVEVSQAFSSFEEYVTIPVRSVAWKDGPYITAGNLSFVNATGFDLGEIPLNGSMVAHVMTWMVNRSISMRTTHAIPQYTTGGRAFHGQPFEIRRTGPRAIEIVDDFVPEVTLTSPEAGSVVSGHALTVGGSYVELGAGFDGDVAVRVDGEFWAWLGEASGGGMVLHLAFVPDGVHDVSVELTDLARNTGTAVLEGLVVDSIMPRIDVTLPGPFVNSTTFALVVSTEPGSNVTVDGEPVELDADGTLTTIIEFEGASVDVTIWVMDRAGNTNSTTCTFLLDTAPPGLSVGYPSEGDFVNATQLEVSGETEMGALVWVNGVPAARDGRFFMAVLEVEEGPLDIRVVARDIAGNVARAVVRVTVDRTPPALHVDLSAGTVTNDRSRVIGGQVGDRSPVHINVNGFLASVGGDDFFCTVYLHEGRNDIVVRARDAAGNENEATTWLVLDTTAPKLEAWIEAGEVVATPEEKGVLIGGDPVVLVVTLDEAGVVSVTDAGERQLEPGETRWGLDLEGGRRVLQVWVRDAVGNIGRTLVLDVYYDVEPPVARAGGDVVVDVGTGFTWDGSRSTDDHGIVEYIWKIETPDGMVTLSGEFATYVFDSPGTYNVTLVVTDGVGLTGTDSLQAVARPLGGSDDDGLDGALWVGLGILVAAVTLLVLHRRLRSEKDLK